MNFENVKILVIGDIILDRYTIGTVSRLSPEAPIPIIENSKVDYRLGGASNVANNIASLGGNVYLIGILGKDKEKDILLEHLNGKGIIPSVILSDNRVTTFKERILAKYRGHSHQQVVRVDREDTRDISEESKNKAMAEIKKFINDVDVVIFSDYNKGFLTKDLVREVLDLCKEKLTLVNTKPNKADYFKGADWFIFNATEAEGLSGVKYHGEDDENIKKIGEIVNERLSTKNLLLTVGSDGMILFNQDKFVKIPTVAKDIADVSGAGDTVISSLALALGTGMSELDSVKISNYAAGVVVSKIGTSTLTKEELQNAMKEVG